MNKNVTGLVNNIINDYGLDTVYNTIKKIHQEETSNNQKYEPILDPKEHKLTAFPLKYHNIWKQYKLQVACFWKPEEIDFSGDFNDFQTLSSNEQFFIERVLAFFAGSDGIINFNLDSRFTKEIQITEILFTYQYQIMMENIHNETYSLQLDSLIKDADKKKFLFNAVKNVASVKKMADWAFKWIDSSKSISHRIVAFAIIEGVFFCGAFASIYWLKHYKNWGKISNSKPFMNGLVHSNHLISRDESLHYTFACEVYSLLENKLSTSEIHEIVSEAVIIAIEFMNDALPISLIGMNGSQMSEYIQYTADKLILMLGYKILFNKSNPFKFMDTIGMVGKSNFFEVTATEYGDADVLNKGKKSIVIDDDF